MLFRSGVGIYTRHPADRVVYGLGYADIDAEGRYLQVDVGGLSVVSLYLPSGSSGDARQQVKFDFLARFLPHLAALRQSGQDVVLCGDWNIAHQPIDLKNWKGNLKNSGFLPEERAWLDGFMKSGFIDTFRHLNKEPHNYSWWSYRAGARGKNLGWRIDYHLATQSLQNKLSRSVILTEAKHSDHCPVLLEINP